MEVGVINIGMLQKVTDINEITQGEWIVKKRRLSEK